LSSVVGHHISSNCSELLFSSCDLELLTYDQDLQTLSQRVSPLTLDQMSFTALQKLIQSNPIQSILFQALGP